MAAAPFQSKSNLKAKRVFRHLLVKLLGAFNARPTFEIQTEAADCGYVGISVVLACLGIGRTVSEVKKQAGTTSRGLTIRQVRDILRGFGVAAEALYFDRLRSSSYPCPGMLLLDKGHYVVLVRRRGDSFDVYDPNYGWYRARRQRLARLTQGIGVAVASENATALKPARVPALPRYFWSLFKGRLPTAAIIALVVAQIVTLSLPLLSQRSVDALANDHQLSFFGTIGMGFLLISAFSMLISFLSTAINLKVAKRAARRLGQYTFDRLATQPISWFARTNPAAIQYQIGGIDVQYALISDIIRSATTICVTLVFGILAFLVVSPWLALPGLIGAGISIVLDLAFNRSQLSLQFATAQATQRRMALNYDLLTQIPLLARFGALARGRSRYAGVVSRASALDAQLQQLKNWKMLSLGVIKSADTLIFVTFAALLMSRGQYSLGAFVALGVYKDLLAQSLLNAFALRQRIKQTEPFRLQTRDLISEEMPDKARTGTVVEEGAVEFTDVSFRYGSLDPDVIRNASFRLEAGQCAVIRGASGIGKSTIARILCGSVEPSAGQAQIDGQPVRHPMSGFGSVLQEDRLIAGSIRENVVMFRGGYSDADVMEALHCAELDDFVLGLPMKLNTQASEHSGGLSGGQRQRLLIARAVLGYPNLIVLDEATASLEVDRERAIIRRLRERRVTLVIISHRPEVWLLADRLFEIVDGEMQEVPLAAGKPHLSTEVAEHGYRDGASLQST